MLTGHLIGDRYRMISRLGKGGMANVYRAFDTILEREVAVKFMRLDLKDDPMVQKRFQNEIQASSDLVNPHITQVYDYGEENGSQYLVTEFVDGKDLKRYELTESPIPLTKIVDLM
jgi:serine/threonine-protein kinase